MFEKFKIAMMSAAIAFAGLMGTLQPVDAAMKLSQNAGGVGIAAIGALANTGGTLVILCGTQPSTPDTALSSNTTAATFTFSTSAYGSPSHVSNTMVVAASFSATTVTAAGSCTATFARMYKADGTTPIADFTVGTSGADINLNSTVITSGGNVTLSSWALAMPVD